MHPLSEAPADQGAENVRGVYAGVSKDPSRISSDVQADRRMLILQTGATEMIEPTWVSSDGSASLYLGDCLSVLPHLPKVDAVVTDPPYGIGADTGQAKRANLRHGAAMAPSTDYGQSDWDGEPCKQEVIEQMRRISRWQVVFGGNYFVLPPARCWLVWDKLNGANDYADCELAWTNLDKPVRRLAFRWHGMLRDGNDGQRVHPTQKPTDVMRWCLSLLPEHCDTILDPFMGSGTTGVAAVRLGRKFIGIEIEPKYFEIAKRRIQAEVDRFALLEPLEPKRPEPELAFV